MKSLHVFLTIAALFCSILAFSQTESGRMLIGGTAGFDVQFEDPDNVLTIDLQPQLGYFIMDDLAVGGGLSILTISSGGDNASSFGISPFGRYYFGTGNTRIFLQAQVGYLTDKFGDFSTKGVFFGAGPGAAFFITPNVAIEAILAFTRYGGDYDSSDLGLRIGVQAYLGGNDK